MDDVTMLNQHHISRRTVIKAAGALALGSALVTTHQSTEAAGATTFYKGADISFVPQMEQSGYYWKNANGVRQDILTILKGYGINAIRLRTWVNPSGGHCSITETTA